MTTAPRRAFRAPKHLLSLQQPGLHCPPMTSDPIQQAALHQGRDHVLCIFVQKPVLWPRSCSMNTWVMIKSGSLLWRRGRSMPTTYEPPPTVLPSENLPKGTISSRALKGDTCNYFKVILYVCSRKLVQPSDQTVLIRKRIFQDIFF